MRNINKIIIHCTANREGSGLKGEDIKRYHVEQLGWSDIGYHYVVEEDGNVYKGRSEDRVGAHVKNYNSNSIGVAYVGGCSKDDIDVAKDTRTEAQKAVLITLLSDLRARYPKATFHGHNEFANKACPSFDVATEYPMFVHNITGQVTGVWGLGDKGEEVKVIQKRLTELKYILRVDGIFGEDTKHQVEVFQNNNDLLVDGLVGDETKGKLFNDPNVIENRLSKDRWNANESDLDGSTIISNGKDIGKATGALGSLVVLSELAKTFKDQVTLLQSNLAGIFSFIPYHDKFILLIMFGLCMYIYYKAKLVRWARLRDFRIGKTK